jgi:hypothetical protein
MTFELRDRLEHMIRLSADYRDVNLVTGWSPADPTDKFWVRLEVSFGNGFLQRLPPCAGTIGVLIQSKRRKEAPGRIAPRKFGWSNRSYEPPSSVPPHHRQNENFAANCEIRGDVVRVT